MANSNSVVSGKFRGSLGKEVVFREWAGKTIVSKAPGKRKRKPSALQAKSIENFRLGAFYARSVLSSSPELAEAYLAAAKPRQTVFSRALEDFLSLPKVTSIAANSYGGAVGDELIIRATDDFRVVNLWVEIYSENGAKLESGYALQNLNGLDWTYRSKVTNSQLQGTVIKAIATDVPNNEGMLELVL